MSFEAAVEGDKPGLQATAYDRVLVAVGRSPNGKKIGADKAGVTVTERGFIPVDRQMRTNVPHIFAIGDIVGNPMLAHKATHEGKLAAEVAAGEKKEWVARVIPSVAYTNPEIAWVGVTETEAKAKGLKVGVAKFPWAASGRAIGIGRTEGFTKLIFDEETHRVIGGAIVGVHAGDLLAEIGLAIEMGAEAEDIGHTIHAHPTLSESVGMAAEVYDGTITDLYIPKKSDAALHDRAATYGTVAAVLTRRMEVAVWWGQSVSRTAGVAAARTGHRQPYCRADAAERRDTCGLGGRLAEARLAQRRGVAAGDGAACDLHRSAPRVARRVRLHHAPASVGSGCDQAALSVCPPQPCGRCRVGDLPRIG